MNDRWSRASMFLHGVSALFIVGLAAAGFVMSDLEPDSGTKLILARMHTLGGFTLMLLTVWRLVVRLRCQKPKPLDVEPMHRLGIRAVHTLLYAAIFALGASGVAMAQASSWPEYLRGEESLAPELAELAARQAHEAIVFVLLSLILAHVGGVIVHELRRGSVLGRMFPFISLKDASSKEEKK